MAAPNNPATLQSCLFPNLNSSSRNLGNDWCNRGVGGVYLMRTLTVLGAL